MNQGVEVIDLRDGDAAAAVDHACRELGFFSVVGHGIDPALIDANERVARAFFARDEAEKGRIAMPLAGRAWRGWFPPGGELTSGRPDGKEGVYFGRELPAGDPRPLHGPNLFADDEMRRSVLALMEALEPVGRRILELMTPGLGIAPDAFDAVLGTDPVVLFRIFHYPPGLDTGWAVGEHSDYGLLTLLWQDATGGLEVRDAEGNWTSVEPRRDALVCNIGDMLDRMTGGRYRSTHHRVVTNRTQTGRISMPFFLDPAWDARPQALRPNPANSPGPPATQRWDGTDLQHLTGTYGEYLIAKVAKVFPTLARDASLTAK